MPAKIAEQIDAQRVLLRSAAGRAVAGGLAALALVTVIGLVVLWPGDGAVPVDNNLVISTGVVPAEVTAVTPMECPVENLPGCARADLRIDGGPDQGKSSYLVQPADDAAPTLSPGDRIRVSPNRQAFGDVPLEAVDVDPSQAPYGFVDFERGMPLLWLALGFVALVAALGRRVGVLSLVGVGVGLVLVTKFVVPAILEGSPLIVALDALPRAQQLRNSG